MATTDRDALYLSDGYALVAYPQAVKQAAYLQALSNRLSLQEQGRIPLGYPTTGLQHDQGATEIQMAFIQGWRAAGGVEGWIDFVVDTVIPCESSWDPNIVSPNGLYRGLGQWDWPTWNGIAALTGYSDIWDPFDQGWNMAYKSRRDGGFAWPECWEARWN